MIAWVAQAHATSEFDLDSEDLEDEVYVPTVLDQSDQRMPLLVGLLDSSHIRRSQDGGIPLTHNGQSLGEVDEELEGVIAKGKHGGGMLDSIANMANSILGAGQYMFNPAPSYLFTEYPGIIGGLGGVFTKPQFNLRSRPRFTLRPESSRLCHWNLPAGSFMHCHGLDHPSYRHQCKTQWQEFLYRNHAPLLRF